MTRFPALEDCDVAGRWTRVAGQLGEAGCDALVVSALTNIRYLTGFTGSNATLLVGADGMVFITDGRYRTQAHEELDAAGLVVGHDVRLVIAADAADALSDAGKELARVGLEAEVVSWATQTRWKDNVFAGAELVPTSNIVLDQRAVKDAGEISRLHRASSIADAALAEVRPLLHEEPTERQFRRALEDAMDDLGSSAPSFETIVASGPNGAKPHARPTDRTIGSDPGELVVIDFGATVDGYHSDMTRTYAVGELGDTRTDMVALVRAAQAAGVAAVRAGLPCVDVDTVCRDVIVEAGLSDAFSHGTGHGIGLEIHESPRLSAVSTDVLAADQCVTVEPGVYLPGIGGVRVEDSVVVTTDGCWSLTGAVYE